MTEVLHLRQVIITHDHGWGKWPDTADDVLAELLSAHGQGPRHAVVPERGGHEAVVHHLIYDREFGEQFARELTHWLDANPRQKEVDAYYRTRLATGNALSAADVATAVCVANHYPEGTTVVDVGCGYGQLGALIAASGYKVTAVDHDRVRNAGALCVQAAMIDNWHGLSNLDLPIGTWPIDFEDTTHGVLVAGNVINSFWESRWTAAPETRLQKTLRGMDAVIDTRTWWRERKTVGEQYELVKDIEKLGYAGEAVSGSLWFFRKK